MKIDNENLVHIYEDNLYVVHVMIHSVNLLVLMTAEDTTDAIHKIQKSDFSTIDIENVHIAESDVVVREVFLTSDREAMLRLFSFILYSKYGNDIPYVISYESGNPVLIRHTTPITSIRTITPLKIWHIRDETASIKPHITKREWEQSMCRTENIIRCSLLTDSYIRMGYDFKNENELELDGYIRTGERAAFVFYDMSVSTIVNALSQIYHSQNQHIRLAVTLDFFYISHKNQHAYKIICDEHLQFIPLEDISL